jgi:hypothetical protein
MQFGSLGDKRRHWREKRVEKRIEKIKSHIWWVVEKEFFWVIETF